MSEKIFCLRRYFGRRYFGGRYFVREDILAEGILSEKVFRRRRYFVLEGIMSGYRYHRVPEKDLKYSICLYPSKATSCKPPKGHLWFAVATPVRSGHQDVTMGKGEISAF